MNLNDIIIVTTESIPGYHISEVIAIVTGGTIRSNKEDEISEIHKMIDSEKSSYLEKHYALAFNRMVENTKKFGADGIVNVRFTTTAHTDAAEILVYGTAVKLTKK